MNAKEFFFLVKQMRDAQKRYFESRERSVFLAARALENDVDREIRRTLNVIAHDDPGNY